MNAMPKRIDLSAPPVDSPLRVVAGWRARQHRTRHGWTIAAVAEALGGSWSPGYVSGVELARTGPGRRGLTVETLQAFAGVLLVSPADLLLRPGQTKLQRMPRMTAGKLLAARRAALPGDEHRHGEHSMLDAWDRAAGAWSDLDLEPRLADVVGINVARWRMIRGHSQTELEKIISGRSAHGRVSSVEHGGHSRHGLTLETLDAFARALDVTPADLVRLPRQPALARVESG